MPGPETVPVRSDDEIPAKVDVVVIGGGIIGTSTALELAERGLSVALCEKGAIGGEQSSRNWGWVRLSRRDPREIDLMIDSIRLWGDLDRRIGADTGYHRCGIAFLCGSDAELASNTEWLANLDGRQIDVRMISDSEAATIFPDLQRGVKGGLFNRLDGRAEPQKAAPAIANAARDRGAAIFTGCAVRTLEMAGGKVSGVVTERGPIACDAVVASGGAWTRLFLGNAGVELPQLRVINSVLRTAPVPDGPEETVGGLGFAARRRQDGGYTVSSTSANRFELTPDAFRLFSKYLPALRQQWRDLSPRIGKGFVAAARTPRRWSSGEETPFERTRILDPEPDAGALDRIMALLTEAFPVFKGVAITQRWAGAIDVTPDAVPVISPVEAKPGLFIATGFSGHGFGIGPGAGRLAADLVTGRTPGVDPTPFRFSRFTDGSPIQPMTGI